MLEDDSKDVSLPQKQVIEKTIIVIFSKQHSITLHNKIKSSNIGRFIQVFTESNHWIYMVQTKEGRGQTTVIYTLKDKNN